MQPKCAYPSPPGHLQAGQALQMQLEGSPFRPEDSPPGSLAASRYASSHLRLTKLVLLRQMLLNRRDKGFYIARAVQVGGCRVAGCHTGGGRAGRSMLVPRCPA